MATPENLHYLKTKRDRMSHDLPGLAAVEEQMFGNAGAPSTAPPTAGCPNRSLTAWPLNAEQDRRTRSGSRWVS